MICLMHAGSGLRNKLNLTSSRELIRTGCCYLLCVYCLDICQRGSVWYKPPGRYPASRRTQTTYLLMSLSCGFYARSEWRLSDWRDIGNSPFFLSLWHNMCVHSVIPCWSPKCWRKESWCWLFFFFLFLGVTILGY